MDVLSLIFVKASAVGLR
jgi:hypothetical protein